MKKIPLTQGKFALIDNRDYWLMRQFKWCAHFNGYNWYVVTGAGRTRMRMHRLLAGFPPFALDHKNGNGLDNRRRNLRPATCSQNGANCGPQRNNASGFKGVTRHKALGKWQAQITFRGQYRYLGLFANPRLAFAAYRKAAKQLFGEFARI
jgi:hypothetical protein